jgi:hypothetical protein
MYWLVSIKMRKKSIPNNNELKEKDEIEGHVEELLKLLNINKEFSENNKQELIRIFGMAHCNKTGEQLKKVYKK